MKTTICVKGAFLQLFIATAFLLLASCGNTQKYEDQKDPVQELDEANPDNNKQKKDAEFLINAADINLEEVMLGQLAQQKGITTYTKELGKLIEEAHTISQNDLTVLAKRKMISIPSSPTNKAQEIYKELNEKTGEDFDKAYADLMVSRHTNAIDVFDEALAEGGDADIKNWATAALQGLHTRREYAMDCQKVFANMYFEKKN